MCMSEQSLPVTIPISFIVLQKGQQVTDSVTMSVTDYSKYDNSTHCTHNRPGNIAASDVFFSEDLTGATCLYYLTPSSCLLW